VSALERDVARHLFACVDTLYRHWGEAAPHFTNDVYVVCAYEGARHFGDLALAWRETLDAEVPGRLDELERVLERARGFDDSGAMSLYAVAVLVGPRLLVSVRDAREDQEKSQFWALLDETARVVVREILRVRSAMERSVAGADDSWQREARNLNDALEAAGMVESLGFRA